MTVLETDIFVVLLTVIFLSDDATETSFEGKKLKSVEDIRYEEACNRLAVEAVRRGCTDNVTVMIVDITSKDSKNGCHASKTS